jgi:hypothetical protein
MLVRPVIRGVAAVSKIAEWLPVEDGVGVGVLDPEKFVELDYLPWSMTVGEIADLFGNLGIRAPEAIATPHRDGVYVIPTEMIVEEAGESRDRTLGELARTLEPEGIPDRTDIETGDAEEGVSPFYARMPATLRAGVEAAETGLLRLTIHLSRCHCLGPNRHKWTASDLRVPGRCNICDNPVVCS